MHVSQRQLFFSNLAQTSPSPLALEISSARSCTLFGSNGEEFLDLISGISVSNVGHCHPHVVNAIKDQVDKHMHLMVYGEYIQSPQVNLSKSLADILPEQLNNVYLVNSGTEAIEGAMKLAKRFTGRTEFISFKNAYHGSTQGALSLMGDEFFKQAYRPLLPNCFQLHFNDLSQLSQITEKTAAVIIEPIQGEAGYIPSSSAFLVELRRICDAKGVLLIFDEIQSGFGRTGKMFAFEHYSVVPDILVLAKGMGGGMPIGAFIANKEIMSCLMDNPVLGHITTFGGHPVSSAAALACIEVIQNENLIERAKEIENILRDKLVHEKIRSITGKGAMLAIHFENSDYNFSVIQKCIQKGLITDWFLFAPSYMRISPPLVITDEELLKAIDIILSVL